MSIAESLEKLTNCVFIAPEPDVLDFTNLSRDANLLIYGDEKISISFNVVDKEFKRLMGQLKYYIGRPGIVTIVWNIKNLLSYVYGRKCNFNFESKIIDLYVLESYLGISSKRPESLEEAKQRLSLVLKDGNWGKLSNIYKKVYLPLITEVLPFIETQGLVDLRLGRAVYSHYEAEGQANGRLKTSKTLYHSYSPHGLTGDDKAYLIPGEYNSSFLYFDFKNMEVSVLQWLSGDRILGEILESEDVYADLWYRLTGISCDERYRKICKRVFLPVVYGLGVRTLSSNLNISENVSKRLRDGVYNLCPQAIAWVTRCQQSIQSDLYAEDYYGRKRKFDNDFYKVRNFVVQSPSSIICLHKLVKLYELSKKYPEYFKLVFHLHDGYAIVSKDDKIDFVREMVQECLEEEDELYPGLRLRSSCTIGKRLK